MGNKYAYSDDKLEKPRVILGNKVRRIMPDLVDINRHKGRHRFPRWTGYGASKQRHFDLRYKSLAYEHGYEKGLNQPKLNNLYIGKKEQWHLHDSQGTDLGQLTFAVISDMGKGDEKEGPKVGPISAYQHLRKEYFDVQNKSLLGKSQKLRPFQAREPLQDPKEKYYSHVIAETGDKAVGFAAVDRAKFDDGENYVAMFYRPTLAVRPVDFSKANVVKKNGHIEPLENLIERIALDHIRGRNLLAVADATEEELARLPKSFRALAPQFDIPAALARTTKEYAIPTDNAYIVVRLPEGQNASKYQNGVELGKAFQLYNTIIREGYIDEHATVKDGKTRITKRVQAAMDMYKNGINALVESAVKVGDKFVVPYKGADLTQTIKLGADEKQRLVDHYLALAPESFAKYIRHIPKF